jgi:hypothetical protein
MRRIMCADWKEMRLAFQSYVLNVDQFQVDPMHQSGGLQDWFSALPLHEIDRPGGGVPLDAGSERIERHCVAGCPGEKKLRCFRDLRVHDWLQRSAKEMLVCRYGFRDRFSHGVFGEKSFSQNNFSRRKLQMKIGNEGDTMKKRRYTAGIFGIAIAMAAMGLGASPGAGSQAGSL